MPSLRFQIRRRVAEEQLALMHQGHAMAAFRLVQIGRRSEDGHAFRDEFVKDAPEVAPRNGIDARGRLVEQNHLGPVNQRADQAELLLHSAGEVSRQALAELAHAGGLQQLRGTRLRARLLRTPNRSA